jgi:hypothetical protein
MEVSMDAKVSQTAIEVDSRTPAVETKNFSLGLSFKLKFSLLATALLLWYGSGRAVTVSSDFPVFQSE